MALHSRSFQDSPAYSAIKVFGIGVAITLVIIGLFYVVYAGARRDRGVKFVKRLSRVNRFSRIRRNRDLEAGTDTASRNSRVAPSVDTLPRYEAGDQAPSEQVLGGEHARVEGEEMRPPPYTFDAGGPVVARAESGNSQSEVRIGIITPPAPVHLQSS